MNTQKAIENFSLFLEKPDMRIGDLKLVNNNSFAEIIVYEFKDEAFVNYLLERLEEKVEIIIKNETFHQERKKVSFWLPLDEEKNIILDCGSHKFSYEKAMVFLERILEDWKNEETNTPVLVSELEGLPLFSNSKKPFISWSLYKNGDAREKWETSNGRVLYTDNSTGSFFKTGEKAWNNKNILVVDLDTDKEGSPVGVKNLNRWAKKELGTERLEEIMSGAVLTPSGGMHLYFTYPDDMEIKNSASSVLPNVDIRATGGIIVLPGTKAKSEKYSGVREYKLNEKFNQILPAPEELLTLIIDSQKPSYVPPVYSESSVSIESSELDAYRLKVWESIIKDMELIVEGERNASLYAQSVKAGSYCIEEALAYNTFAKIMKEKGMGALEFETTFARGYAYGAQNPKKIEQISKGERRMNNDNTDNTDNTEKFARVEELEREARNIWEWELDKLGVNFISDKKNFIYWCEDDEIWKESSSAGKKLRAYRREKVQKVQKEAQEKGLNVKNVIKILESETTIKNGKAVVQDELEKKNNELNSSHEEQILVENGVLDLKTGEMIENTKDKFYTKRVNASYEGTFQDLKEKEEYKEANEQLGKVLSNLGSEEMKLYMQGVLGSGLVNRQTKTTKSFWWYSSGGSGKSAVANLLKEVFGDYASKPSGSVFKAENTSFELANLENSRIAIVEEAPTGYLDAARLKSVVGSSEVSLANKNEKARSVPVTWKIHVMTNNLPWVRPQEYDHGTFRRIVIVPFLKKHAINADEKLMEIGKDPLVRNLTLSWLVEGAQKWLSDGKFEDKFPEEIRVATEDWHAGLSAEVDPMQSFIQDHMVEDEESYINANDFFSAYKTWCEENNVKLKTNSLKTCNQLEEKLKTKFTPKARPQGKKVSHYSYESMKYLEEDESSQKKRLFGFKFTV